MTHVVCSEKRRRAVRRVHSAMHIYKCTRHLHPGGCARIRRARNACTAASEARTRTAIRAAVPRTRAASADPRSRSAPAHAHACVCVCVHVRACTHVTRTTGRVARTPVTLSPGRATPSCSPPRPAPHHCLRHVLTPPHPHPRERPRRRVRAHHTAATPVDHSVGCNRVGAFA